MSEVLAIKYDDEPENFIPKKRPRIVAIPQFQDNFGMSAEQWARLYLSRMELDVKAGNRNPQEAEFLFQKIKEQYPGLADYPWSVK